MRISEEAKFEKKRSIKEYSSYNFKALKLKGMSRKC